MAASHAGRNNMNAGDEYDDMEDWYSSSFPRSPASSFTTKSTIASEGDGLWVGSVSTLERETWRITDDALEASDDFGNDYEILIDEVSTSRTEYVDTVDHDDNSRRYLIDLDTESKNAASELTNQQLQLVSFKRKLRTSAPPHEIGTHSCDRCKSDLNRKLMVSCSTCSFRRHLYCYTPPLNQHPVFNRTKTTARGTRLKTRASADDVARFICDLCVKNLKTSQSSLTRQILKVSPDNEESCTIKNAACAVAETHIISTPTVPTVERKSAMIRLKQTKLKLNNEQVVIKHNIRRTFKNTTNPYQSSEGQYHRSQSNWRCNRNNSSDWNRYRADKYAKVISSFKSSECFENRAKQGSELVFYSDSLALLRGTAVFWQRYAAKKKYEHRRRDNLVTWTTKKFKAKVMHLLSPQDLEKIENTQLRKLQEFEHDSMIFDDRLFYKFDNSSRLFEAIRRPRMTMSAHESPCDSTETAKRVDYEHRHVQESIDKDHIWGLCLEISEMLSMSHEDINMWPNDSFENNTYIKKRILVRFALHQATRLIQTVLLRWKYRMRRTLQSQCELRRREDEQQQRRNKAGRLVKVLCLCVKFIIVIYRQLRNFQAKKDLLLVIRDAAEDKAVLCSIKDISEQQKLLAANVIRRFFSRKVQLYIYQKKIVMSKRIQRFWKHTTLPWKWRDIAVAALNLNRNQACIRIQKLFRRFRTKTKLQRLTRDNAILRVRRFLRGWLFQRIIKKEMLRMKIYESVFALGIANDLLQVCPDASISKILYDLGMVLYRLGDFWNAAWMLHQASKNDLHALDWNGRVALAYSHHMAWYTSYDMFNLDEAHDIYCLALESISDRASKDAASVVDPSILQDLAIVKMHKGYFGSSLQLLAKLIEFFPHEITFSLWVFLAAIQLQQKGDWEQSIEYLVYLQDIAPEPYLERDILALCAICYERTGNSDCQTASKEAWKAALRLWNLEPKDFNIATAYSTSNRKPANAKQLRKREMLTDFATRAFHQGHYLLTCQLLVYVSTRLQREGEENDQHQYWWTLAESFRHLGHIDLYRSVMNQLSSASTQIDQKKWVEVQSNNFREDVASTSILEKLRSLSLQYAPLQ